MKDNTVADLIKQALTILKNEVGLAESSIKVVASRSFKPISDYFREKQQVYYDDTLVNELDNIYRGRLQSGSISRNVSSCESANI